MSEVKQQTSPRAKTVGAFFCYPCHQLARSPDQHLELCLRRDEAPDGCRPLRRCLLDANATGSASGSKSFNYDENSNLISDGRKGLEMRWIGWLYLSGRKRDGGGDK